MKTRLAMTALALAGVLWLRAAWAQEAAKAAPEDAAPAAAEAVQADAAAPGEAPAAAEAAAEDAKELSGAERWRIYWEQGGNTMYFIALLSVLGLGCALERFCNLRRSRMAPDGFSDRVVELWKAGRFDDLAALCRGSGSILARVVETLFRHRDKAGWQEAKTIAEDKLARELRLENRRASMISTAATLSPLLGLFGTVVGLLGAFGTVAAMGEMGDASVLADDIGKALVTTVAGLAVSMPCLFAFDLVKKRLNFFAVLLEEEVAEVINRLFLRG